MVEDEQSYTSHHLKLSLAAQGSHMLCLFVCAAWSWLFSETALRLVVDNVCANVCVWIWVHRVVDVWWRGAFVYTEESVCVCLDWKVLHGIAFWVFLMGVIVCLSDFSPDPWSPPECGPDESHRSQDALHPGMAVPAWVWNHPFPRQVSFVTSVK